MCTNKLIMESLTLFHFNESRIPLSIRTAAKINNTVWLTYNPLMNFINSESLSSKRYSWCIQQENGFSLNPRKRALEEAEI